MARGIAQIRFPTHQAYISQSDDKLICFKHNDRSCDFEVFSQHNNIHASDYLLEPLKNYEYHIAWQEESEQEKELWTPIVCRRSSSI
jgi:hypothetical protein